jgi:hypothetical protein
MALFEIGVALLIERFCAAGGLGFEGAISL